MHTVAMTVHVFLLWNKQSVFDCMLCLVMDKMKMINHFSKEIHIPSSQGSFVSQIWLAIVTL